MHLVKEWNIILHTYTRTLYIYLKYRLFKVLAETAYIGQRIIDIKMLNDDPARLYSAQYQ